MKPTSAPPQGGRVPWQDLLLAVSLLTLWNPPTTAQVTVESVPSSATEGKDVLLQVHNLTRDTGRFNWFKEATTENRRIISYILDTQKTILGPAYSGRETVYPNGSLLFQNITLNDTGVYTIEIIDSNYETVQITGQLHVSGDLTQSNPGLAPGAIAGIVIGVLAGVAVIATLVYFLFIRKTGGANDLRDVTEHKPSASNHSQDHSDNLSKSEEVAYSSLNFSAHEPKKSTSAPPSPADTETVYTEVQKK
uniref:Immunoglobulin V-set domain-containing protein n=1 Tax=Neovison vison TaxID=452646 RepID=A0A8C7B7T4_NEOVI